MNELNLILKKQYKTKIERLKMVLICTFVFGLAAHGFAFANLNLSHDSLNEFYLFNQVAEWKIQLGRYGGTLSRIIMGEYYTMPWLSGFLGLLFISVAVYLTLEIFQLSSFIEIILLSGIYSTNITITSLAGTYITDFINNTLALAFSVYVVYVWKKNNTKFSLYRFFSCCLLVSFITGIYQSYFSVSIVLTMIYSIIQLINKNSVSKVFKDGIHALAIFILGFIIYLLSVRFVYLITGIKLIEGNYNSVSNLWKNNASIIERIVFAYVHVIRTFVVPTNSGLSIDDLSNILNVFTPSFDTVWLFARTMASIVLTISAGIILLKQLLSQKFNAIEKILIICLVSIIPLAMDLSYVGSGVSHDLMHFSYWLIYLLEGLLVKYYINQDNKRNNKYCNMVLDLTIVMMFVVLIFNVETSNAIYVKKDLEAKSTLSTMTRVLENIEHQDIYIYGETPIAFVGIPSVQRGVPGTENITYITGNSHNSSITYQDTYEKYFDYYLQYDICVCNKDTLKKIMDMEDVKLMPVFPNHGSVATVNDVIVVKLSEY